MTNELDRWLQANPRREVELVLTFRPFADDVFVNLRQVRRFARRLQRRRLPGLDKAKIEDVREFAWFGKPAYLDTKVRFVVRQPERFAPSLSDQDIHVALSSKRVNLHRIYLSVHGQGSCDTNVGSYTKQYDSVYFYCSADDDSPERRKQDRAFIARQELLLRRWWAENARPMW